ncbi:hypothetical protein PRNP1_001754 [Phytophthora ramorum]
MKPEPVDAQNPSKFAMAEVGFAHVMGTETRAQCLVMLTVESLGPPRAPSLVILKVASFDQTQAVSVVMLTVASFK